MTSLLRRRSTSPPLLSIPRPLRDRALDHIVEREKNLFPFLSLKDRFFSLSPILPHSLPLPSISPLKTSLSLPSRPLDFIRLFPSAFSESFSQSSPSKDSLLQVSPSRGLIEIHEEEMGVVQVSKDDVAERVLKLLMLSPERKLPVWVVGKLRWDLGLPSDFVETVLPNYPDFFRVKRNGTDEDLELVCYRRDLAVSAMERRAESLGDYRKGSPLSFPLNFSKGFELEKNIKKRANEFQALPYISPYERGARFSPKSDLAKKWSVGVLHEILNLFIGKKTERSNLILLGEKLRLPPGFRKAIVNHPGIFYVSSKLNTQTVVLREGYKRNLLVEKHPLMGVRYRYLHLMHLGKPSRAKKDGGKKRKEERESEERGNEERESEFEDFDEERESEFDEEEEEEEESEDEDLEVNRFSERKSGGFRRGERKMRNVN